MTVDILAGFWSSSTTPEIETARENYNNLGIEIQLECDRGNLEKVRFLLMLFEKAGQRLVNLLEVYHADQRKLSEGPSGLIGPDQAELP